MKHQTLVICALFAALAFQSGCMSSPITATAPSMGYPEWALLGLGAAGGAGLGELAMGNTYGGMVGGALGLLGTQTYLSHVNNQQAQIVAEAKEEARREERAKLMQDYWTEASGTDYVGHGKNGTRDVRYDAGVYDGVAYERRDLPRQIFFQEPPR